MAFTEDKLAAGQKAYEEGAAGSRNTLHKVLAALGLDHLNISIHGSQPFCYFAQLVGFNYMVPEQAAPLILSAALKSAEIARNEVIMQVSIINHEIGWKKRLEYVRSLPGVVVTQVERSCAGSGSGKYTAYCCLVPGPKFVEADKAPVYIEGRD